MSYLFQCYHQTPVNINKNIQNHPTGIALPEQIARVESMLHFIFNHKFSDVILKNISSGKPPSYKILGVFMDSDLKWNSHVQYIFKKACKKLHSLRVLRRAGVNHANILKVDVYLTTVRPVLEYAVPVWQSIPGYLSDVDRKERLK